MTPGEVLQYMVDRDLGDETAMPQGDGDSRPFHASCSHCGAQTPWHTALCPVKATRREAPVIDLMEALKTSLAQKRGSP